MVEEIVLVDDAGNPIGTAPKLESHTANTPLHLAFSCYLFNESGKFLLTQRAHTKKVWPDVWTNSVCGHPAPGEELEDAIRRRADFELGIKKLEDIQLVLPAYRYKTPPYKGIVENEVCPVFTARVTTKLNPNPDEVEAYRWIDWQSISQLIATDAANYSYWFKDQHKQLLKVLKADLAG